MTKKVEYSLLAAFIAFVYSILSYFFPDFPINADMLLTLLVYILVKLGVEIVGKPAYRAVAHAIRDRNKDNGQFE